jgi:hypothetical protein
MRHILDFLHISHCQIFLTSRVIIAPPSSALTTEEETHLLANELTNLADHTYKTPTVSMRSPYNVNVAPWAIVLLSVASITTTVSSAFFVPFSTVQTTPIQLTQQQRQQQAHRRSSSQQQQITHRTRTPPQPTTTTRALTKRWASNMLEDIKVDNENKFDLETALFCGGLAFDAYTEPPANSSRWERGVSFLCVLFGTSCILIDSVC